MYFFYQFLLFLAVICSPIILLIRFLKDKEDKKRFVEKFGFIKEKRIKGNLLWIHVASVGELMSVLPLIHELEKIKSIKSILLTTSTLSSSRIFKTLKFKKTIHQFFPIDLNFFTLKFIRYWKPKIAIFIDSEIWPNMFKNLKRNSIPIMPIINEAKERVCRNLLNKVIVFDQLIDKAEAIDNPDKAKELFLKQANILNRLEKVIS